MHQCSGLARSQQRTGRLLAELLMVLLVAVVVHEKSTLNSGRGDREQSVVAYTIEISRHVLVGEE